FTEEKLGQAERTEYDADFENLLNAADQAQNWTERIVASTEAVLEPNPAHRDMMCEKLERGKRDRPTPLEELGTALLTSGNELGPGSEYGNSLVKVGQTEQRLAQLERDFIFAANAAMLRPMRQFLAGDMKTIQRERRTLENLRLDLDSAKARLKRAKQDPAKKAAEEECERLQAEFEKQLEVTRLLLEGLESSHSHHLRCLNEFVDAQMQYYAEGFNRMQELQRQLGRPAMH
uniref:BAR domain-containing protein n=2 Tax=Macrostomum lignano TaxID=282301 RepID=A0A1I8G8Z2_9PLAT